MMKFSTSQDSAQTRSIYLENGAVQSTSLIYLISLISN